jgi:putative sigma-54 modulation protein
VLSVDKLMRKVEANVHVRGKDLHAEAVDGDMYAAIDLLSDKLDRMVLKHKEIRAAHRPDGGGAKRQAAAGGAEGGR